MGMATAFLAFVFVEEFINLQNYKQLQRRSNQILEGAELQKCLVTACKIGCKTVTDWKNAYYTVFGSDTACANAIYKEKFSILKDKVSPPRHSGCYFRRKIEFLSQEGLDYDTLKDKYINTKLPIIKPTGSFLIPQKLNFVWLTSQKEFKQKPKVFYKINEYIFHNTKITPNWKHTLWVNDKNLVPDTVKQDLLSANIALLSLEDLPINNPKHLALKDLAKQYAAQNIWGMASDIARDLVEYYEGGIYVDGDYKILDASALEGYMQSYRSFFSMFHISYEKPFFEIINAFMATEPKGAVISKKIDLTYRNTVTVEKAPLYIQYPCNFSQLTLIRTGPQALAVAFFLAQSKEDVLIPHCYLFQHSYSFNCIFKHKIGKHDFHNGWLKPYLQFVY